MEKLKQLPIKVELGLLEEELRALLNKEHQISANRQDSEGDWVSIKVFKTKKE